MFATAASGRKLPGGSLVAAMAGMSTKLDWSSEGWDILRAVRGERLVNNVARTCNGLDDDTFEVMFNDVPLEALVAAGNKYPTDLPEGGRFMRRFGGRAPAPLANLPPQDFEDWISMHQVAEDMLYVISLGLGGGLVTGEKGGAGRLVQRESGLERTVADGGRTATRGVRGAGEAVLGEEPAVEGRDARAGEGEHVGSGQPERGAGSTGGGGTRGDAIDGVIKGEPYIMLGPTVLRSKGECKEQLMHVDHMRPAEMAGSNVPKLSMLMAVQNGTKVNLFSGSHRILPKNSGGCMLHPVPCTTVVLNAGEILVFRQDLVHCGAASSSLSHRWHWYADTRRQESKKSTFYVLPFGTKTEEVSPPAPRRSSRIN